MMIQKAFFALALSLFCGSSTPEIQARIKVAIFGFGRAGKIHFRNLMLNKHYKISYIVETPENLEATEDFLKSYPMLKKVKVISSEVAAKVFEDSLVDALFICTPTELHSDQIQRGLSAGKHIFCEKPLALNKYDIEKMYQLAENRGVQLFCGLNARFDPYFKDVKKMISLKKLGVVHNIVSINRDYPYPSQTFLKKSGGIFFDSGTHDIDLVNWILEERPVAVIAKGNSPLDDTPYGFENAVILLEYPSGVLASIHLSRKATSYDQRIEIYGSDKEIQVSNPFRWPVVLGGSPLRQERSSFSRRYHLSYVAELDYFVDLIHEKVPQEQLIKKEDVLTVLRIVQACHESIDKNERIVIQY